ncbi:MAG: hypothetical protein ACK4NU_00070 [Brevundimonas sp.]
MSKLTETLDDHAFRTLAALAAGEVGFYPFLSSRSRRRAAQEGWATRHGVLSMRGQALLLAEQARRSAKTRS